MKRDDDLQRLLSTSGPEFDDLRAKARAKIKAKKLPATSVVREKHMPANSKHRGPCSLCERSEFLDAWWLVIEDHDNPASNPPPELHVQCHTAWKVEVISLEAGAWSLDP